MAGASDPCRLFVYLARDAPIGVVLRRGPSDWARLSVWHTDSDTFEHGQWIKGRVYERRSDVSADGALFCAFVRQSGGRPGKSADTWIAVSRPPYFSALAVWFAGGTYHTGGFFPDRASLWIGYVPETPPDVGSVPPWLRIAPPRSIGYIENSGEWPERTVHFNRLRRDGWELQEKERLQTLWRRRHPRAPLFLHMSHCYEGPGEYGGPYIVEYSLWNDDTGRERVLGTATWADWDHQGRLILSRRGQLIDCSIESEAARVIADFNDQSPDPQPAPDRVLVWPDAPAERR